MLMRVRRLVPRAAPWRLVLVTVLAGLLHLLGCAHGAQAAGLPRADSLPAVGAVSSPHTHPVAAATSTLCDHGAAVGCTDVDEPAAAGPRADLPVPPATGGGLLIPDPAGTMPARSRAPCGNEGSGAIAEHSRARAVLGVWRT
ncbi:MULTISPECIES: hypothetical protein [unclassified Streptomyces]|uniref:hypothetical protein n=1 Tax=unclassified Streptomyces TaxID=2593676 RepID=UPI0036EB4672